MCNTTHPDHPDLTLPLYSVHGLQGQQLTLFVTGEPTTPVPITHFPCGLYYSHFCSPASSILLLQQAIEGKLWLD